jgi:hypothetical protein
MITGINIKSLQPKSHNARTLIQWLEQGVFDALEKKYVCSTEKTFISLLSAPAILILSFSYVN